MPTALSRRRLLADALIATGGAAVAGAVLASPEGLAAMAERAVLLPLLMAGTALVMMPPLYIATTSLGVAPPAAAFLQCASGALRSTGIVLFGLAPPLAFLVSTSAILDTVWLLGNAVVGLAALLGVRALWYSLFLGDAPGEPAPAGARARVRGARMTRGAIVRRPMVLFLLWLAIGGSIAASLFQETFE